MSDCARDYDHEQECQPVHRVAYHLPVDDFHVSPRGVTAQKARSILFLSCYCVSLSPPILRETERGETDGNHQNDGYPIGHIPSDNIFICHRLASVVCRLTRPELQNAGKYTPDFLASCRLGGGGGGPGGGARKNKQ